MARTIKIRMTEEKVDLSFSTVNGLLAEAKKPASS
jgi:hypothetical protein